MSIDKEIVEDFVSESKTLIEDLLDLLENIEGDFTQVQKLADYGNNVDRIMGGAKNLAVMSGDPDHALNMISDYAALCKAVGYKASQITDNEKFYDIAVALLLDATETLNLLLDNIHLPLSILKQNIPQAFIERLRWVSNQFNETFSMSVGLGKADESTKKMAQTEIDDLLKKLGL